MEIWKEIEGYKGYEISTLGNIKSFKRYKEGKLMKQNLNWSAYPMINLYKNGKNKVHSVHRLVAQAFIPNPENKRTVNHINGIKTDNRVENLEWATDSENNKHAYSTKLRVYTDKQRKTAIKNGKKSTKPVIDTSTGKIYKSLKEAAESTGTLYNTLMRKLTGHRRNNTSLRYVNS